ncbi:MAG: YfhO family protein [Halioglobus sp.]
MPVLKWPLTWLLLLLNIIIWLPVTQAAFPTIGIGHDSQLFTPGIHALLRGSNMPWDLLARFPQARVDIFSYPYFSVIYPFYWTLGLGQVFTYEQHLLLDFLSVMFHMAMASVLFAVLLRRMGCRSAIAAIGSIAYAYSLYMKLWSAWIWAIATYAWLPLCLIGAWELVVKRRYLPGALCLAAGFGMISLATGVGLIYALTITAIFILAMWCKDRATPEKMLRDSGAVIGGGLLGAGIGAAHLLPVFNRMDDYIRWYTGGSLVGEFKPPYEGTIAPALQWPTDIVQFVLPIERLSGGSVGHLYVGAAVLILALFLLVKRSEWRRPAIVMWLAGLYFFLDALGDATPVHALTYQLPLLGSIRYPLANVVVPVVLVTLMGCLALEKMLVAAGDAGERGGSARILRLILYSGVLLSTVVMYAVDEQSLFGAINGSHVRWLYALPGLVSVIALIIEVSPKKQLANMLPLAVVFAYLPQYTMLVHPKIPDETQLYQSCDDFRQLNLVLVQWAQELPDSARLLVRTPKEAPEGCLADKKLSDALLQSLAVTAGWNVVQGYLSPRPYLEFKIFSKYSTEKALGLHSQMLQAGVSHVLALDAVIDLEQFRPFYKRLERVGPFVLYEVRDWRLGQDLFGCVLEKNGKAKIYSGAGSRRIGLPPELQEASDINCQSRPKQGTDVRREMTNSSVHYQLQTKAAGLFVTDRVMREDWRVSVNGKAVQPVMVDGYRLALPLAKGPQQIDMHYRPLDFRLGLVVSVLSILLALTLAVYTVRRSTALGVRP